MGTAIAVVLGGSLFSFDFEFDDLAIKNYLLIQQVFMEYLLCQPIGLGI